MPWGWGLRSKAKEMNASQASRPLSPTHPRSVQWKGVTTWAPLSAVDDSRPASRASRAGSTMVLGIRYSSLEWSKCPLTFTGLYSRFRSSSGLQGRGETELGPRKVWQEDEPSWICHEAHGD